MKRWTPTASSGAKAGTQIPSRICAVAVLFDVTGSMGRVPRILQENLCELMDLLLAKGYLAHPQVLIGGIGDATCDRAPLQIGQFESGIEIDQDLAKLWLEGGGGGQQDRVLRDGDVLHGPAHLNRLPGKAGRRGYLFLIGDEMPYRFVRRDHVAALLGERIEADIPVAAVLRELQRMYDTYFILPNMTNYYRDRRIHRCWTDLLGDKFLRLEDPQGISELIAAVIGMSERRGGPRRRRDRPPGNWPQPSRGIIRNALAPNCGKALPSRTSIRRHGTPIQQSRCRAMSRRNRAGISTSATSRGDGGLSCSSCGAYKALDAEMGSYHETSSDRPRAGIRRRRKRRNR